MGTYIIKLLSELYPKITRFSTCVIPVQGDNDVVTSPYNTILALDKLIKYADCVFPLDNAALLSFAQIEQNSLSRKNVAKSQGNTPDNSSSSSSKYQGFDEINNVAGRMLCHVSVIFIGVFILLPLLYYSV